MICRQTFADLVQLPSTSSMSLEQPGNIAEPSRRDFFRGAVIGGGIAAGAGAGAVEYLQEELKKINECILTPGAMKDLQEEVGASDTQMAELQKRAYVLLYEELLNIMKEK
jgi:hypothetical protein